MLLFLENESWKYHLIILGDTNIPEDFTIQIDNVDSDPESAFTRLDIRLDIKLGFEEASKRFNAGRRISEFLTKEKKSVLITSFSSSHFNDITSPSDYP